MAASKVRSRRIDTHGVDQSHEPKEYDVAMEV